MHGYADELALLLTRLGYERRNGAWRHSERQVIFVGDFIDRGPKQVETVMTVRQMVDAGSAVAVMGNHEFNAIAWFSPDPANPGQHLRPHADESPKWGAKNRKQHEAFLKEVEHRPELHREIVECFLTLPMWLELSGLRVVHACWHQRLMQYLEPMLDSHRKLNKDLMVLATREPDDSEKDTLGPTPFKATEALTKGIEVQLPSHIRFTDKDGIERSRVRVRWWDSGAMTYRAAALLSDELRGQLPDIALPPHAQIDYEPDKPVFFGHYWLTGDPQLLSSAAACVDYSAGHGAPLVAYRWQGERKLDRANFWRSR